MGDVVLNLRTVLTIAAGNDIILPSGCGRPKPDYRLFQNMSAHKERLIVLSSICLRAETGAIQVTM
jgi:hypothetical protein